jgi:hypothetical protein
MIEKIDVGNTVICDICGKDWTNRTETGGWLFASSAYCPDCATPEKYQAIKGYHEEKYITALCPERLSFKDWVLSLRGGDNTVKILTGSDFDDWINKRK